MLPLVSIVIPVYNSAKYLEECLTSVIQQSYTNIEIILVDDGSTDGSGEICDRFSLDDKRIKVIHNTNHGASYSRNIGIDTAIGSWLMFVDSDDTIDTDCVQQLVEVLNNKKVDLCIGNVRDIYTSSGRIKSRRIPDGLSGILNKDFYVLFKVPILSGPVCKLYDIEILKNNKIYFEVDCKIKLNIK